MEQASNGEEINIVNTNTVRSLHVLSDEIPPAISDAGILKISPKWSPISRVPAGRASMKDRRKPQNLRAYLIMPWGLERDQEDQFKPAEVLSWTYGTICNVIQNEGTANS